MNKYLWLIIFIVVLIAAGIGYQTFLRPKSREPFVSGKTVHATVTAKKDAWLFEPETIEVEHGDKVVLTVVNEDNYDHGIAITAFGISQRMPALSTITVEFIATQLGDHAFYCSVPCGEGDYQGKHRTHFDMTGKIKVVPRKS